MNNFFILIIILIIYFFFNYNDLIKKNYIYFIKKNKRMKKKYMKKKINKEKMNNEKINNEKINNEKILKELNEKIRKQQLQNQKLMINHLDQLNKMNDLNSNKVENTNIDNNYLQNTNLHLISAYSTNINENNYNNQLDTVSKKLYSIDDTNNNQKKILYNHAPAPESAQIMQNEIIGITNAPMYAPIESIDNPAVDIFLINQINNTTHNLLSYLENPLIPINKINYNKSINSSQNPQSIEFVVGNEQKEYSLI